MIAKKLLLNLVENFFVNFWKLFRCAIKTCALISLKIANKSSWKISQTNLNYCNKCHYLILNLVYFQKRISQEPVEISIFKNTTIRLHTDCRRNFPLRIVGFEIYAKNLLCIKISQQVFVFHNPFYVILITWKKSYQNFTKSRNFLKFVNYFFIDYAIRSNNWIIVTRI